MCACGCKPIVQATCTQYARHKDFKGFPIDDDTVLFKLRVFLDVVMVVRVNVCGRGCQTARRASMQTTKRLLKWLLNQQEARDHLIRSPLRACTMFHMHIHIHAHMHTMHICMHMHMHNEHVRM